MPLYLGSFTSIDSVSAGPGSHKTEQTGPGSQVEDGATSSPLSHRCRDPRLEPGIWENYGPGCFATRDGLTPHSPAASNLLFLSVSFSIGKCQRGRSEAAKFSNLDCTLYRISLILRVKTLI